MEHLWRPAISSYGGRICCCLAAVILFLLSSCGAGDALNSRINMPTMAPLVTPAQIPATDTPMDAPTDVPAGTPAAEIVETPDLSDVPVSAPEMTEVPQDVETPTPVAPAPLTPYEEYLKELYDAEEAAGIGAKLSYAVTTADLLEALDQALSFWDGELNRIYALLMEKLPKSEREELRQEERLWIQERDDAAGAYVAEFDEEPFSDVAYNDVLYRKTKERVLELIHMYFI